MLSLITDGHVTLPVFHGCSEHRLVLRCGIVLGDRGSRWAVKGARFAIWRRVGAVSSSRSAVCIGSARNAGQNGGGDLAVLFFLLQHFESDNHHRIFRLADALIRFDLRNAKLERYAIEIVDPDHENRAAVRLHLARCRPNQHHLPRDQGRLPVPDHCLLIRIRRSKRYRLVIRDAAAQRGAKRHAPKIRMLLLPGPNGIQAQPMGEGKSEHARHAAEWRETGVNVVHRNRRSQK